MSFEDFPIHFNVTFSLEKAEFLKKLKELKKLNILIVERFL